MRGLIGQWPLDDGQSISAWDASVWPRDDAETSPGRGYHSSASRQAAGQPIVAGWSSGWLAQVSFTHDNWTALLDVLRVAPTDDVHAKTQNHPTRGSRGPRPVVRETLVLVEVERLPRQTRIPKQRWLWWRGPGIPDRLGPERA